MGAFDCELAAMGYSPPKSESEYQPPAPKGFYVSWDGSNGGATGKWFDSKTEAIAAYRQKFVEGRHPSAWFEVENLPKRKDCSCDRCQCIAEKKSHGGYCEESK